MNEEKLQNKSIFKFSAKVLVCNLGQNLIMTKTSYITVNEEKLKNIPYITRRKLNLKKIPYITVNEDKLQNWSV